jgi:hypothetical protein
MSLHAIPKMKDDTGAGPQLQDWANERSDTAMTSSSLCLPGSAGHAGKVMTRRHGWTNIRTLILRTPGDMYVTNADRRHVSTWSEGEIRQSRWKIAKKRRYSENPQNQLGRA